MGLNFGQNLFPPRGEFSISYDFFDIADGTGYATYYGMMINNGSYTTTPNANVGSEFIKTYVDFDNVLAKEIDIDFDINFNTPKNIKGDIIVNVPIGVTTTSTTQVDATYQAVVKAYHYNGTTETQLGSTATSTLYSVKNMESDITLKRQSSNAVLKISVPKTTHFRAGEILRITVEGWFNRVSGSASQGGIAHDPTNRNDKIEENDAAGTDGRLQVFEDEDSKRLSINVPFKLDV